MKLRLMAERGEQHDPDLRKPRSRRAVLTAAAAGAGALVAQAIGGSSKALAADGGNFILGQTNGATSTTVLANSTPMNAPTLEVQAQWSSGITSARAIQGDGGGADGVWGMSSGGLGVVGSGQTGVRGMAPTFGMGGAAVGLGSGVAGFNNGSAPAVLGQSLGNNTGVQGFSGGSLATPPAGQADTGVLGTAAADLGTGVRGTGAQTQTSNSIGVLGDGDTGILGVGTFGVLGSSAAGGLGVYGSVSDTPGVPSIFGGAGVTGQSDTKTGVLGFTGLTAPALAGYCGVYGVAQAGGTVGRGVYGYAPTGVGLQGQTSSGTGVKALATSTSGTALRVQGKASFDRSGKIVVTAGHSSVVKTSIALTSSSFVIATLQTNVAGLFVQAVVINPAGSSFTIYLNKAPSVSVSVAWMVVN